jgi:CRP/FNR family cyclic AMP-dependent transcriptional regulator
MPCAELAQRNGCAKNLAARWGGRAVIKYNCPPTWNCNNRDSQAALRQPLGGMTWPITSIDFGILAGAGAPTREFKAGEIIFKQGDPASEFFVIQSGKVDIRLGNRSLGTLSDHDIFGEMALIDAAPRSATAIAATDVKLVPVGEKQFLFLVSRTPYFALNIMRVLARRLRAQNSMV